MCAINDQNRDLIQYHYIDSIISNLDFMQVRDLLGECLNNEKTYYTNEELEDEIKARGLWWEILEPSSRIGVEL